MDYLSIFYFLFASVLCTCTFMYEPQYNESTEVQTLGTFIYDEQK